MAEKKRKREAEDEQRPTKKTALSEDAQIIKVNHIADTDGLGPVIASAPGLSLPLVTVFKPYSKIHSDAAPRQNGVGKSSIPKTNILLHSAAHPKLDYVGREEPDGSTNNLLRHYVGIYDPKSAELEVIPVRKVIVRSTLRSPAHNKEDDVEAEVPTLSARSQLGLTFGTKKSQRAIRSLTENAIGISPTKPSTPGSSQSRLDPAASAVVDSMASITSSMPTRAELQKAADDAKPRPVAMADAKSPLDVYTIDNLVGGDTLKQLMVMEWNDGILSGKGVTTTSSFASRRLARVVHAGDVKKLKTLRYLLLLIEWYRALLPGSKAGKKMPGREEVGKKVTGVGTVLLEGVRKRFADGASNLTKWHQDNLITHICALALIIDNCEVDVHDLREDLRLETKQITQYFQELGCRITSMTDAERARAKPRALTKAEAADHKMARLRLPLEFPKTKVFVGRKR